MATTIINEKAKVGKNLLKMLKAIVCIENEGSIRFLDETEYLLSTKANTLYYKQMKNSGKTDWDRLRNMDDKQIDYSDIPETKDDFWEDARVLYPHKKVTVKFKIDEDIAVWLKQMGTHSDHAVNNLLRSYYISSRKLATEQNREG